MSLTELYYRLPFEPSPPAAPNETSKAAVGNIWGTVGWIVAVVACFALVGAIFAFMEHKNGNNEGAKRAGYVVGAAIGFGFIVGLVATVTGT